jgi:hypothetical protein
VQPCQDFEEDEQGEEKMSDEEGLLCIKLPPITCECTNDGGGTVPNPGTLKDFFAAHAITGLLAGNDIMLQPEKIPDLVDAAFNVAERMMVERDDVAGHRDL